MERNIVDMANQLYQREQAYARQHWALSAYARSSQSLVHSDTFIEMVQGVCAAVVDESIYTLCCVGLIEPPTEANVKFIAAAGPSIRYIDELKISSSEKVEEGRGPAGRSIRSGKSYIENDIRKSDSFAPWAAKASLFGIKSVLVVPLKKEGRVLGIMNIYASETNVFEESEVTLFERLANEIIFKMVLEDEKKKSEQSDLFLRSISDNLPVLIGYMDAERKFRFINKTGEQWYARPASEIVGKTSAELTGFKAQVEGKLFKEQLLEGRPVRGGGARLFPDGKTRITETAAIPDISPDGTLKGYFRLSLDITQRKEVEDQLRELQKREAIGQLTGGIAHDFNNLLMIISGNLEIVSKHLTDSPDSLTLIKTARSAVVRGATLTRSLLAFSRQQPLKPSNTNVNDLLRDLVGLIRRTLVESIDLTVDDEDGSWSCEVDPGQLQNALLNLIANARDAMPDGGRLTIKVGNVKFTDRTPPPVVEMPIGDYVEIAVADTGHGMSEEVIAKAFDPFFTTKDVGKGSGLGLSMVYGFVTQSKGYVSIDSAIGLGTTVRIYLPRAQQGIEGTHHVSRADPGTLAGKTVLVVEDDADVRTLTVSMLRSAGLTVLEADRAEKAFQVAKAHPEIDLLLSDVVLPGGKSGRYIAEELQRRIPSLKVLDMSGYTEDVFEDQFKGAIEITLLHKPFTSESLIKKVVELFNH
jgi:PAS domain S-box-containing protein